MVRQILGACPGRTHPARHVAPLNTVRIDKADRIAMIVDARVVAGEVLNVVGEAAEKIAGAIGVPPIAAVVEPPSSFGLFELMQKICDALQDLATTTWPFRSRRAAALLHCADARPRLRC
ncbi:MAG: hypothetical protein ACR2QH_05790 [Geminicoccaceae bacterium]